MQFLSKQGNIVQLQYFTRDQSTELSDYLHQLSNDTKQRFAPHGYEEKAILDLYEYPSPVLGFIAFDTIHKNIIAYSIIHLKILKHEAERFYSNGIQLTGNDALFAPSVADAWQGLGVGTVMFRYIKQELKKFGIKRLFLWGGVQTSNKQAIQFYSKHGFKQTGIFEYKGQNSDMMLELTSTS